MHWWLPTLVWAIWPMHLAIFVRPLIFSPNLRLKCNTISERKLLHKRNLLSRWKSVSALDSCARELLLLLMHLPNSSNM